MLRNYLKIALRTLLKNKVPSAINIVGLSVAIACAVVVYLMVHSQLTLNTSHEHADNIFAVHQIRALEDEQQTWAATPAPLGPALEAEFPQVERAVRVEIRGGTVHRDGNEFAEGIHFVDPGFLDMFTYPLKHGRAEALENPGAVILSAESAIKYFGSENPVGQSLTISFGDDVVASFTVGGVAEAFPANDGLGFGLLINYDKQRDLDAAPPNAWTQFTDATFIQVETPAAIANLAGQMAPYVTRHNAAAPEEPIAAFSFANLLDLSQNTDDVRGSMVASASWTELVMFSALAAFLLLLSCINYVNIALSTATQRLKEIGVRKAMGTTRLHLVGQFLTENLVLCFGALALGTLVAHLILVPVVSDLINADLGFHVTERLDIWVFLIGLLAALGIASGSYPAVYISSFQPIAIFRGKQTLGRRRLFMQGLLTFQFVLAFVTIVSSIVFMRNGQYLNARDWGYNPENTLVVRLDESSRYDVLRQEAAQWPQVVSITGARHHLEGGGEPRQFVEIDGTRMEAATFAVGPNYLETLEMRLRAGAGWNEQGRDDAVVINEAFAEKQGWSDPVGKPVGLDSTTAVVAGVVENFHYDTFFEAIDPVLLHPADPSSYRFLVMRVEAGTEEATVARLEAAWHRLAPNEPFSYFFQHEVFERFDRANRGLINTLNVVALLALFISCMGLFGLVSHHMASRMKEISIRKVLGASLSRLALQMNRRFLGILLLAACIATPLSYFMLDALLDAIYTYRMDLGAVSFIIAIGLLLVTGVLTASPQIYRLAMANPADILRDE